MRYILDTNVISELIAKQPRSDVLAWLDSLDSGSLYLTVITLGEIRKGVERLSPSARRDSIKDWLETDLPLRFQGKILEITTDVALVWGDLVGRLENEGRRMAAIDSLIAAIALQGHYTLITRNDRDFQHAGVMVINPWKDE